MAKTTEETRVQTIQLLDKTTGGSFGAVSGGDMLKWMDITACMAAEKFAGESCVTLIMDDLSFPHDPATAIRKGDLLTIKAQVNRPFGTSMEIGVSVEAEDLLSGEKRRACCAYFMFVLQKSKNEDGTRKALPSLNPITEEDKRRFDQALDRRAMRNERNDVIAKTVEKLKKVEEGDEEEKDIMQSARERGKSQEESITTLTELILPSHANHMGNLFGGQAMAWMESAAYVSAMRHARAPVVLLSIDYIHFYKPAFVGDRVTVTAVLTHVFKDNAMEVMVVLSRQSLKEGSSGDMALAAFFVFCPQASINSNNSSRTVGNTRSTITVPLVAPMTQYAVEYEKALGREKIRLKRQALRTNSILSLKWTSEYQHELFVKQLILRNLEALLKLNEDAQSWSVAKKVTQYTLSHAVKSNAVTCMAITGDIGAPPELVFKVFTDPQLRPVWDPMFKGAQILNKIDDYNAVVRMVFQSTNENTAHEMVLLRSLRKKYAGKEFVIANVSVDYPNTPKEPGVTRSEILASGYILQRISAKKPAAAPAIPAPTATATGGDTTRVICLFQFGGKALSLALGDMLDKTSEGGDFVQAFLNIKKLSEEQLQKLSSEKS